MNIAMISYNAFLHDEENGLKERNGNSVLLLQNQKKTMWGLLKSRSDADEAVWRDKVIEIVGPLWAKLLAELDTIDKVVIYVGAYGAERVIDLAALNGLVPEKAIFVMCDCNIEQKVSVIHSTGFSSSRVIDCVCGGQDVMLEIYRHVLDYGVLQSQPKK